MEAKDVSGDGGTGPAIVDLLKPTPAPAGGENSKATRPLRLPEEEKIRLLEQWHGVFEQTFGLDRPIEASECPPDTPEDDRGKAQDLLNGAVASAEFILRDEPSKRKGKVARGEPPGQVKIWVPLLGFRNLDRNLDEGLELRPTTNGQRIALGVLQQRLQMKMQGEPRQYTAAENESYGLSGANTGQSVTFTSSSAPGIGLQVEMTRQGSLLDANLTFREPGAETSASV